jgi:hypothetical protein
MFSYTQRDGKYKKNYEKQLIYSKLVEDDSSASSIGTTNLVGFGLLNCR